MNNLEYYRNESSALLMRLNQVVPFEINTPTVHAALISFNARNEIQKLLYQGKKELRNKIFVFRNNLIQKNQSIQNVQNDFSVLKLKFNSLLDQLDIFADVYTQRSEINTGVWLSGLDFLASDALKVVDGLEEIPPLICYLDRGHGAAIRRARTRLPGGKSNPVGIIRVPRERMVSSGIASSLIHEVGHQGSALLNLMDSMREAIRVVAVLDSKLTKFWALYERWISEIISDFWAVAHLGISATYGLVNVVSLPKYFVFRFKHDDPHPFPWIRVMISACLGKMIYPDAQWNELIHRWQQMYPLSEVNIQKRNQIKSMMNLLTPFCKLMINHTNDKIGFKSFVELFPYKERQPDSLRRHFAQWKQNPKAMFELAPVHFFATVGQAKADGLISAKAEHKYLTRMLNYYALNKKNINNKK